MSLLAADLGGTKLALAVFSEEGILLTRDVADLNGRQGKEVGLLVANSLRERAARQAALGDPVRAIGIAVPGISRQATGTVWAPNIPRWEDYPLEKEVREAVGDIPVVIDSDRACCILGEVWRGAAQGCSHAIFLTVGTGIGAGILVNGQVLRGARDIAGAIGWLGLDKPYQEKYIPCGCFEYHASGDGLARVARAILAENPGLQSPLGEKKPDSITAHDVFTAYYQGDSLAVQVIQHAIEYWGMAVANLVSLFNPEKIIFGGGVFGPAIQFIPDIYREARKWGQPISMTQVVLEGAQLGGDAGLYGAGRLALEHLTSLNHR
ncbi:MAG: Glucokinase [Haliscomenobacter sp.]|nr:Glucokinase [Haliscomenobacter sp.]